MNTTDLKVKIHDIVTLLDVSVAEADELEQKRILLEKKDLAISDREKAINAREQALIKKDADIKAQILYIEEQNKNTALILTKINTEKEALKGLADLKQTIDREKADLEITRKEVSGLKQEKEVLQLEWANLLKQKSLFDEEKRAMIEQTKLIAIKEQNIKTKEEKLDKIERMTSV